MNGTIRLYSHHDNRIRAKHYTSKRHRQQIIEELTSYYSRIAGIHWGLWYFRISPYIYEPFIKDINKFVHTEKKVINNPSGEIDMPDYVWIGCIKRETYFHKCYYRN